jgi:hypothetical protein
MRSLSILVTLVAVSFAVVLAGGRTLVNAQEGTPEAAEGAIPEGVSFEQTSFGTVEAFPPATVNLYQVRVEPGASFSFPETDPGLGLHVIESGTMTLFGFTADLTVTRAAGMATPGAQSQEVVPAGSEVTLGPGDSFTWEPYVAGEVRNDGSDPLLFVTITLHPVGAATPEAGEMAATPAA